MIIRSEEFMSIRVKANNKIYEAGGLMLYKEFVIKENGTVYRLTLPAKDLGECNLIKIISFGFENSSIYIGGVTESDIREIYDEAYMVGTCDISNLLNKAVRIERVADIPQNKMYYADSNKIDAGSGNIFQSRCVMLENESCFSYDSRKNVLNDLPFNNNPFTAPMIDDTEDVFDDDDGWDEVEEEI